MARRLLVDGVDRLGLTRRGSIRLVSTAHLGQVGNGGWDTDDDAAALLFPGLKVASLIEDASGSDKTIWRGRIWLKNLARGDWMMGNARRFSVTVVDSNWDLTKLRVHNWVRPIETDVARVQAVRAYILNTSFSTVTNARYRPSTLIGGTLYVPNTNMVTMEARTYDATDPWAVIDDCARTASKAFFVIVDDSGTTHLLYDVPTSTAYASTLSITDDGTANGITSYAPGAEGPMGIQDPSELLSGGGLVYATGQLVTAFDGAVETAYDVAETTIYDSGAPSAALAAARLSGQLGLRGIEETRYRCFIEVTPARAHLLKAGMTLSFRSAAAGVTSPLTVRVVRCDAELTMQNMYRLHLELQFPAKIAPRISNPGVIPILGQGTVIGGATTTLGYLQWHFGTDVMDDVTHAYNAGVERTVPPYYGPADAVFSGPYARSVNASENARSIVPVIGGNDYSFGMNVLWAPDIPNPNRDVTIQWCFGNALLGSPIPWFQQAARAMDTLYHFSITLTAPPLIGGLPVNGVIWHGPGLGTVYLDDIEITTTPPPAFHGAVYGPVLVAIANGVASSWTLPYPRAYMSGTLAVTVDGIPQTATEISPAAGTFSLPWVPGAGDIISATWRTPVGP